MTAIEIIAKMREQQIKNDNGHEWHTEIFKTTNHDRIVALVRAAVVIVEEIDRLMALEEVKKELSNINKEKTNG